MNVTTSTVTEITELVNTLNNLTTVVVSRNLTGMSNNTTPYYLAGALNTILYATANDTTLSYNVTLNVTLSSSATFVLLSNDTLATLAKTVDLFVEATYNKTMYTVSNQNLIRGLQSTALRLSAQISVSDSVIAAPVNGSFQFAIKKYNQTTLFNRGIVSNVNFFGFNKSAIINFNHNISV